MYVARLAIEEAKILWNRRPITEVLSDPDKLDSEVQEKLKLVLRVRTFAERELGFEVGDSYSSLSRLREPPILYVLTAAEQKRLELYTWWFPVVGRVGYRGYFDRERVTEAADRLVSQGYDTYVRTATAFSTLGWFADPVLPSLLFHGHIALANVILHELFHGSVYFGGQTAFNESLANFAGHRGAIGFFEKENGLSSPEARAARASWSRELQLSRLFENARQELLFLYSSGGDPIFVMTKRKQLFQDLREKVERVTGQEALDVKSKPLVFNNAVVLQFSMYLEDLDLFERLYLQNGKNLKVALEEIVEVAKDSPRPFLDVRKLLRAARP